MGTSENTEAAAKLLTPGFEVTDENREDWKRLRNLLNKLSVKTGDFTLASGRKSDLFIDCKETVLTASGHYLVGALMGNLVRSKFPEAVAVAGVEVGGCPLASAVSMNSYYNNVFNPPKFRKLQALYVRKRAKDHGTQNLVEGGKGLEPGAKVVLLEDVITTGGSSVAAMGSLMDAGYTVVGVIALVDRLESMEDSTAMTEIQRFDLHENKLLSSTPVISIYTRKTLLLE